MLRVFLGCRLVRFCLLIDVDCVDMMLCGVFRFVEIVFGSFEW